MMLRWRGTRHALRSTLATKGSLGDFGSWVRKGLSWTIAVVLLSIVPRAQGADEATLRGTVRDPQRAALAGATVSVLHEDGRPFENTTTDADGTFSIALPPGSYRVTADLPGFWGSEVPVEVAAGEESRVELLLTAGLAEVVTVTATKVEQDPLDVPFSLAVLGEQDLRDRGAENLEDVATNVGSLTVQSLGPGQSQVAMRGVSAGQIARDQPGVKEQVGVYLDESPVSMSLFTPDLDLVDMNRVEVLRGPQGTLFGAGSVTGTVRYVSQQPRLEIQEGFVEVGGAGVTDGDGTAGLKAGINIPFGERTALRAVGYDSKLAGFTDAVQPGFGIDDDVNDGHRRGGRAAVTFVPADELTITPRVLFQQVESDGWNLHEIYNVLANPFTTTRPPVQLGERQEHIQLDESFEDDFLLADVVVRYDLGWADLTSISSFLDREIRIVRDTTQLTATFTGGDNGFPEPIYTLDSPLFDHTDARMWSQEVRLSGEAGRLQWLAGVFYSDTERDYGQDVKIVGFEDATGIPTVGALAPMDSVFFSQLDYDQDQRALFGEATYALNERFDLTGGLRWYAYDEDKEALVDGVFVNPGFPFTVQSNPGQTDASGLAPRLIATYELASNVLLNAQVSKGFRLGGINDPINVPLCSAQDLIMFGGHEEWDDETVWNYEAGVKTRLRGGKTDLNVSLFYIDIEDLQTTVTAGTCTSRLVFNVPQARSQGVEVDFATALWRGFDVAVSASYNDAELRSTLTSTDAMGGVSTVSGIEKGRRLPTVPELQAALTATYRVAIGPASQLYASAAYRHVGSRFTQVGDEDLGTLDLTALANPIGGPLTETTFTYDPKLPAYDLLNLRLGWRRAHWDVALYANNVTDELAYLALERERGTLARIGYLTNPPRTIGLLARYDF